MRRRGEGRFFISHVARCAAFVGCVCLLALLTSCARSTTTPGGDELVMLLETYPPNLDPRIGTDAQSQRIASLIFSGLLARSGRFDLVPDLAYKWEQPDALTYVFHLRQGVTFHDGRALTSADVKFTLDSIRAGTLRTPKRGSFRLVRAVEAPDPLTVIIRLTEPYASFLTNVARPAIGIVPAGSAEDFGRQPIGTGPFRFVSAAQDDSVVLERSKVYFSPVSRKVFYADLRNLKTGELTGTTYTLEPFERVRFRIVPDATTRALELRRGSADLALNSLNPDMVPVLGENPAIDVEQSRGSNMAYLAFNCTDAMLARREVRQALAYATDRYAIVKYLLRDQAEVAATSILPIDHWAFNPDVPFYKYDLARAEQILDAAGLPRAGAQKIRFRLELKTSTEEQARLIGAILQDQWRKVGIELELRPLELATLLADANRGAFQVIYLRWVGANNDPDIFEFVFSSKRFPPEGANRGRYANARLDEILGRARVETDRDARRRLYFEAQQILAVDMPYLYLWYPANVAVFRRRVEILHQAISPAGDYDFLMHVLVKQR